MLPVLIVLMIGTGGAIARDIPAVQSHEEYCDEALSDQGDADLSEDVFNECMDTCLKATPWTQETDGQCN